MSRKSTLKYNRLQREAVFNALRNGSFTVYNFNEIVSIHTNEVIWGVDNHGYGELSPKGDYVSIKGKWFPLDDDQQRFAKMAIAVVNSSLTS